MSIRERWKAYELAGGAKGALALDDRAIEARVEGRWHSCRLPPGALRALMQRSDRAGLANFAPWILVLAASGVVAFFTWGSWWAVPAFFVYGTLYTSSDAHWHECGHGTAFRSRWLNEGFYHLLSFMCLREAYLWRWSHARHHMETMMVGRDPEITVPRPANLPAIASDFLYLYSGSVELRKILLHAAGVMTPGARQFVPESQRGKMVWSSRIYVGLLLATIGGSLALGSLLPLMFVALPRFYGAWFHQLCVLTQHAGLAEMVRDHRLNTRTVYMNRLCRFLYVNMNYHIEHHMYPMVPFHALPRLHALVKDQMPPAYRGFRAAYREILPTLIRQARDPEFYVRRPLPQS